MSGPPILSPPISLTDTTLTPLPPSSDAPPPNYAPSRPQILVAPLSNSASFFRGRTVEGEVFVKGLGGEQGDRNRVKSLIVTLTLTNHLPHQSAIPLHDFPPQTLWPQEPSPIESTSAPHPNNAPFPTTHPFSIALPTDGVLPGTLNLTSSDRGEVSYTLTISLKLSLGDTATETIPIEGTPQDVKPGNDERPVEVEKVLDKDGVVVRMLFDTARPRLGKLLRLGVEIRGKGRDRTGEALADQPNPADTLRPLRRVRVEFFRKVLLNIASPEASSSSTNSTDGHQHLTLLYTSGKSLRYPGTSTRHPPLRVLFTLPTAQLGSIADQTWGEITQSTPCHDVSFFVRVTLGFGSTFDEGHQDWHLERELEIRPKLWHGSLPPSPNLPIDVDMIEGEEAREAYRQKSRDVTRTGTHRTDQADSDDLPPPFEGEVAAGPSTSASGLPTFLESEEAARQDAGDRSTRVGRSGSLGGELGTWIEYDGYETFSVAPPSVSASFGVGGSMDPPQEGDEDNNILPSMAARLGLPEAARGVGGMELMEQLGLGEGTRVIDLQDDLPPAIDEPSFPALPGFTTSSSAPPSFAASEAAQAVGRVAAATDTRAVEPEREGDGDGDGDEPPGYFGGPPAYS